MPNMNSMTEPSRAYDRHSNSSTAKPVACKNDGGDHMFVLELHYFRQNPSSYDMHLVWSQVTMMSSKLWTMLIL